MPGAIEVPDNSPAMVGGMFDDITSTYDRLNRTMSFDIDSRWRRKALGELGLREGEMVLDAATGTGDMAIMAAAGSRVRPVGIDMSMNMLRRAAVKWAAAYGGQAGPLVQGNALALPFRDESFDKVMVSFGVRNMPDVPAFLAEAHRVLRTGGRLLVLELSVPTLLLVRQVYRLYLTRAMPLLVRAMGGNASSYRYLTDSIITFPPPDRITGMMRDQGFEVIVTRALTLGACYIYLAEKR